MITVATNPTFRADCTTLPCNTLCYHCIPKKEKNKSHQAMLPLRWREIFLPDVSAVVVVVVFVGHVFNKALKEKCKRKKFAPETQPKAFRSQNREELTKPSLQTLTGVVSPYVRTAPAVGREKIRIFIAYKYGYNAGIVSLMKPRKGRGSDQCWPVIFFFFLNLWVGYFLKFFWDHTGYQYQYNKLGYQNFSVTTVGYA